MAAAAAQPRPSPEHDRLEAAIAQDNPTEVRRILAHGQFTAGQRRYLNDLLRRWEEGLGHDP